MAEYIERQAALAAITKEEEGYGFGTRDVLSGLYIAEDCVSKVPAADVAPVRHGRWLLEPTNPYDDPGYKNRMIKVCSCCHWSNACKYNYCPNCGAKMDEEGGK